VRQTLAALLIAIAPLTGAEVSDIASGIENLEKIFGIAHALEIHRAVGTTLPKTPILDPWGTPYRIDGFRIISAGSDRRFDEASWKTSEQFIGTEGDVVFDDGTFVRTNHNWLCRRTSPDAPAVKLMREAEMMLLVSRTVGVRAAVGPQMTSAIIANFAKVIEKHRSDKGTLAGFFPPADALDIWKTPLRVMIDRNDYRIISAGADRRFDPKTWSTPPSRDPAEDIVFENGKFTRQIDVMDLIERSDMTADPIRQPPDRPMRDLPNIKWMPLDKSVTAPVVIERVEPEYPEGYRRVRIAGIVVVELAISETGTPENLAVLKSLGPAIEAATIDAVRKWKFAPAIRDGKPIPVLFNLTINFKLN